MECVGVDVFVFSELSPIKKYPKLESINENLRLISITYRGTPVWPKESGNLETTDLFCCRFVNSKKENQEVSDQDILDLLHEFKKFSIHWVHIEKLNQVKGRNLFS